MGYLEESGRYFEEGMGVVFSYINSCAMGIFINENVRLFNQKVYDALGCDGILHNDDSVCLFNPFSAEGMELYVDSLNIINHTKREQQEPEREQQEPFSSITNQQVLFLGFAAAVVAVCALSKSPLKTSIKAKVPDASKCPGSENRRKSQRLMEMNRLLNKRSPTTDKLRCRLR